MWYAFATNELQHVPYRDQAMGASRAWAWSVRPSIDVCYIAGLPLTNEVIIVLNILHHSGGPLTNSRFNYHDISCQGPLRGFLLGGPYHSLLLAGQHTADRCLIIFLKKVWFKSLIREIQSVDSVFLLSLSRLASLFPSLSLRPDAAHSNCLQLLTIFRVIRVIFFLLFRVISVNLFVNHF